MQTRLEDALKDTAAGEEGRTIVGRCVHCGFCNATCPTYQLLGDELDGPRGRIYLIRQVLEGGRPTAKTQLHLDRCLTCRACETTCPSGVQYGRLLDIGRKLVESRVSRPRPTQLARTLLKAGLTSRLFAPAWRVGQALRAVLPPALRAKLPPRGAPMGAWPARAQPRRMLLLQGCVQPTMLPDANAATARVLDAVGIQLVVAPQAQCCGAIRHHLSDFQGALEAARRNIDAWWGHLEGGVEAIVMNASGCGAMVREYGHLLRGDRDYATRAARVAELTRDVSEVLAGCSTRLQQIANPAGGQRLVFHAPCTLQHAQRIRGVVEGLLRALGAEVLPVADGHLCCGSAGTYSLLQPTLATELRDRKLAALQAPRPQIILSANVGCIAHLAGAAALPVQHWIEWVAARLAENRTPPT